MFVDRARIEVHAGRGGDGKISFRREKYEPRGGPDGGDGGDGGSVILRATKERPTLAAIARRSIYKALDGRPGRSRKMAGRCAEDLVLEIPPGTLVYDAKTNEVIADMTDEGQELVLARGGRGGLGNPHFASATVQVPRVATRGAPGDVRRYVLELKLIADVGLLGLPNAGKSTLLRRVSRARPKIAAYPFTTLKPCLGVVELGDFSSAGRGPRGRELVIADLPGLIEGAHAGKGLGDEFLRHIERCRVMLHLIDGTAGPELGTPAPLDAYRTIRAEVEAYDPELAAKPEVVALSKVDALDAETAAARARALEDAIGQKVHRISGVSGEGIDALIAELAARKADLDELEPAREPAAAPARRAAKRRR